MTRGNELERVYTVVDYFDGPRRGIADYRGQPHLYEADAEGGTDRFRLYPVSPVVLQAALEDWEIWRRWERAFHEGRVPLSTHPALPEDRVRHHELVTILAANLRIDPSSAIRASGEFVAERADADDRCWPSLLVRWSSIPLTRDG